MIRESQKKRKEGKYFGVAAFVRLLISIAFITNPTKTRRYHNAWPLDIEASVHISSFWAAFTDYRAFESPTNIQSIGRTV